MAGGNEEATSVAGRGGVEADEGSNVEQYGGSVPGPFVAGRLPARPDGDTSRCVAYRHACSHCLGHINACAYAPGEPFGHARKEHPRTADAHGYLNASVNSNPYAHSDAHAVRNADGDAHRDARADPNGDRDADANPYGDPDADADAHRYLDACHADRLLGPGRRGKP